MTKESARFQLCSPRLEANRRLQLYAHSLPEHQSLRSLRRRQPGPAATRTTENRREHEGTFACLLTLTEGRLHLLAPSGSAVAGRRVWS